MDNLEKQLKIRDESTDEISNVNKIFTSMYDLKKSIIGLSSTGVAISQLESLSNDLSGLLSSDYFTISKPHAVESVKTGQKSSEVNMRYGVLRTKLVKEFRTKDHFGNKAMLGKWVFGTMNQSRIRMATSKIAGYEKIGAFNIKGNFPTLDSTFANNHSAINLQFFRERLLPMIDRLSSIYYNSSDAKFTYPTRVGDIESILKRGSGLVPPAGIYSPRWSNITSTDRLIIGEGSCAENNFERYGTCSAGEMDGYTKNKSPGHTAGEERVVIETRHFPAHKHKIECDTVSFHMEFHLRGTVAAICCTTAKNSYGRGKGGQLFQATTGTLTPYKMTGSVTFSTAHDYGSSIRIHDDIYDSGGNRVRASRASSHNNIPPVIFVRMIKRDS